MNEDRRLSYRVTSIHIYINIQISAAQQPPLRKPQLRWRV